VVVGLKAGCFYGLLLALLCHVEIFDAVVMIK